MDDTSNCLHGIWEKCRHHYHPRNVILDKFLPKPCFLKFHNLTQLFIIFAKFNGNESNCFDQLMNAGLFSYS